MPTAVPAGAPTFPVGAQTRRVDPAGRLIPGLDAGNLGDLLDWVAGGLEVTFVFSVNASGVERIVLRPAYLERISLPADRYLLLAPLPDVSALVAVNPAAFQPKFAADPELLASAEQYRKYFAGRR